MQVANSSPFSPPAVPAPGEYRLAGLLAAFRRSIRRYWPLGSGGDGREDEPSSDAFERRQAVLSFIRSW